MKIAAGWLYWGAYQVISIVLTVLGLVVVGILASMRLWTRRESCHPAWPGEIWAWKGGWLTAVFGNEEDGIGGASRADPKPWPAFHWCAVKNSANGLRMLPLAYFEIDQPPAVRYTRGGFVATVGWRQCRVFSVGRTQFRIGWMIDEDAAPGWRSWPVMNRR